MHRRPSTTTTSNPNPQHEEEEGGDTDAVELSYLEDNGMCSCICRFQGTSLHFRRGWDHRGSRHSRNACQYILHGKGT